uniref:aldehyde dehydrogenase family protein n=1 Tax=Oceanispirochaeta sp. TaxID=2035350 RepID=UPI00260E457E
QTPLATQKDIDEAVSSARNALEKWRNTPVHTRSSILMKYAETIDEHKEELAHLESLEMGKRINECRDEVNTTANLFRGYAEKAKH